MSFLDLYMNRNPLITGSDEGGDPVATIFGVPFDATQEQQTYYTATASFRYTIFDVIDVNGKKV